MSEQELSIFKIKTKISDEFRSMKSLVNVLSIIKTFIKRNINIYDSAQKIINNEVPFA